MFPSLLPSGASSFDILFHGITRGVAGIVVTFAAGIATTLLVLVPLQLYRISLAPKDIPWVGQEGYRYFPKLMSTLVALKYERQNLEEGWEKYSSKGKPFVRPSLHWPSVVLPPSNAEWLAQQPENYVAASKVQDEILGFEWLASGPSNAFIHDFTVIRRDLTRQINACVPEILDEIRYACDKHFSKGQDVGDGWKNVSVNDAVRTAVCGVANRIIVGIPVCRSEEYFRVVGKWWICFGLTGLVFRSFIPGPLKNIIMPFLSMPTWYWRRKIVNMFEPELARRIQLVQDANTKGEPLKTGMDDRPNDLMQWLAKQSAHSTDPAEMSPRALANKLVLFNLFATHTLTATLTTLLTTILTQDETSSKQTLSALRAEAAQILSSPSPQTKQMPLHDSVLRETLRLNPSFDDAMLREIAAPAGLTTPDGTHLPRGSHVAMHTRLMQRSSWSGEGQDWTTFQPFRYHEMATATTAQHHDSVGDDATTEEKAIAGDHKGQISAVHSSAKFMPFGLGKHACPGRFFASSTLKLMLAYLVLEFDMQPFPKDAQPKWIEFGGVSLLAENTVVKVRKVER